MFKNDDRLVQAFVVHGYLYWASIIFFGVVGLGRFVTVLYKWFQEPINAPLPSEALLWLLFGSVFPILLHISAALAEVRLNRSRKRRYTEKKF